MEEPLENAPLPEEEMYQHHWDPRVLDQPFYDSPVSGIKKVPWTANNP